MFADAVGWAGPIHFARNVGGHAAARLAQEHGVRRLVFAHICRLSIRAIDRGAVPEFGEWGVRAEPIASADETPPGAFVAVPEAIGL